MNSKKSEVRARTISALFVMVFLAIFLLSFARAPTWVTNTQALFSSGTFINVSSNSSNVIKFIRDLPNNRTDESANGGINMSGNILLMHLNNDSAYGENSTRFYDFSGIGSNATCSGTACPTFNSSGRLNGAYQFDGTNDYVNLALGGTINYSSGYTIHTFTANGSFTASGSCNAKVLVVAGGGGGGPNEYDSGGGGAGGYQYNASYPITAQNYTVTVGLGGRPNTTNKRGGMGQYSVFGSITAIGGGGGGDNDQTGGGDGGSGGGGGGTSVPRTGGTGSQGYNGGDGWTADGGMGGGGGAGGAGGNGNLTAAGNGGIGVVNPITGSTAGENVSGVYYLCGGGGGSGKTGTATSGIGGYGGGGNGSGGNAVNGTDNTGGGGGGGERAGSIQTRGGSGIVIIEYLTNSTSSSLWIKPASTNVWEHIAYNGSDYFKDGIVGNPTSYPLIGFTIGINATGSSYFNGTIDEVAIWNRTLSAAEISKMYNLSSAMRGIYQSTVLDTNSTGSWKNVTWTNVTNKGNTNITMQVRSCNDPACSGEEWQGYDNTSDTYFNDSSLANLALTNLSSNRYFQYQFIFQTNDTSNLSNTPELYNVSVIYDIAPTVTLNNSPANKSYTNNPVTFNCSAVADSGILTNITLYLNSTGTWKANLTNAVAGTSNSTNFTLTLSDGSYIWNCEANDTTTMSAFASANFTFVVDSIVPYIKFITPTEVDNTLISKNWTYVNTTISDTNFASAFIDWNNSLLGYWSFNGQNANDATGINNGTITGATWTSAGNISGAYTYSGTGDYINVGNVAGLDSSPNFSISMWFYSRKWGTSDPGFISKADAGIDWEMFYCVTSAGCADEIVLWLSATNESDRLFENLNVNPSLNTWHYLVVTKDGYTYSLYLDNVLRGTDTTASAIGTGDSVRIGVLRGNALNYNFNGTIDEVSIWNKSLDAQEISYIYNNLSSSRLERNFTNLTDGSYNYRAWAIDKAGNVNKTEMRTIITAEQGIKVSFGTNTENNASFKNRDWIYVNTTAAGTNEANITFNLYNSSGLVNSTTNTTAEQRFLNWTNLPERVYYYNVTITSIAGVLDSTETRTLTLDTTPPTINATFPANNSYLNQAWINITGTASDTNAGSIIINDTTRFGLNTGNYTNWNFTNITTIADGNYSVTMTANDSAGNTNSTNVAFAIDTIAPHIANITNISATMSYNEIDPNVILNITASINDSGSGLDTVILQYRNYSQSNFVNMTMNNLNNNNKSVANYNGSFIPDVNGTWYYRIWANDSVGNINTSENYSFDAQYECEWNVVDTIGTTSLGTFGQTKLIGNITLNNTGDPAYSPNNCTLNFILTDNLASGRMSYVPNSAVLGLAARSTAEVSISAEFLTKVSIESLVITTTEYDRRSSNYSTTINTSLVSYAGGPYIEAVINGSPTTVNQTNLLSFTLSAYVKNIGNESANNVTLNWTLPTGWGNLSGQLTVFNSTLNCSTINTSDTPSFGCSQSSSDNTMTNILSATVSDPKNAQTIGSTTVFAVSFTADYTNSTCNSSATNCSYINSTANASINIACYSTPDTICGNGCVNDITKSNYDPDCSAGGTITTVTTSGGGGGGGGAAGIITSEASYELVRGRDQGFFLQVDNPYADSSLTELRVDVEGFLAQYIDVEAPSSIPPKSSVNLSITIKAPSYFTRGVHNLTFTITSVQDKKGAKVIRTEKRYISLIVHEISRSDASALVEKSRGSIEEMKKINLGVKSVSRLIELANTAINSGDYEEAQSLSSQIETIVKNAVDTNSIIEALDEKIKNSEYMGIKTPESSRLVELAKAAMAREDYALALERAKEAELTYAMETKGEFNLAYFVARNSFEVFIGTLIALAFLFVLYLRVKLTIVNSGLKSSQEEEEILLGLMKEVQKECFSEGKKSMEEYNQAMMQYEDRLGKTVQHVIELETIKTNLFRFKREGKRLGEERERILNLMKNTQEKYLKEGMIETRVYQNKMHSFSSRLSEIEEKMALKDAEAALKKGKSFFRMFSRKKIYGPKEEIINEQEEADKNLMTLRIRKPTIHAQAEIKKVLWLDKWVDKIKDRIEEMKKRKEIREKIKKGNKGAEETKSKAIILRIRKPAVSAETKEHKKSWFDGLMETGKKKIEAMRKKAAERNKIREEYNQKKIEIKRKEERLKALKKQHEDEKRQRKIISWKIERHRAQKRTKEKISGLLRRIGLRK